MCKSRIEVAFDEKKIDEIFSEVNQRHLPGAAVGVAINGKPVYRKGFVLANMELPITLSPSIRMRIHSITKHFAYLAYLLLCEENKSGIDDELGKYLPELHPVTHKVTLRQLMGNVGGLRDSCELTWEFSGYFSSASSPECCASDVAPEPRSTGHDEGYRLPALSTER
jgi:D-aminopeptidase